MQAYTAHRHMPSPGRGTRTHTHNHTHRDPTLPPQPPAGNDATQMPRHTSSAASTQLARSDRHAHFKASGSQFPWSPACLDREGMQTRPPLPALLAGPMGLWEGPPGSRAASWMPCPPAGSPWGSCLRGLEAPCARAPSPQLPRLATNCLSGDMFSGKPEAVPIPRAAQPERDPWRRKGRPWASKQPFYGAVHAPGSCGDSLPAYLCSQLLPLSRGRPSHSWGTSQDWCCRGQGAEGPWQGGLGAGAVSRPSRMAGRPEPEGREGVVTQSYESAT